MTGNLRLKSSIFRKLSLAMLMIALVTILLSFGVIWVADTSWPMIIIGLLLVWAFVFFGAAYLNRRLLKPLYALIETAYRVTDRPELPMAIENPYEDEFSILIDAFNHMLERLQGWQQYLRDWIDSMPTVLLGIDKQGNIVLANQTATQRFGTALNGQPLLAVCPWLKPYQGLLESIWQHAGPEVVDRIERQFDYKTYYYRLVMYPLQHHAVGAVVRLDDITQEVQLMDTMIQHEKMMSVGGLAAGMAHELNNPLSGIVQHAQNIERRLSTELPANQAVAMRYHLDFNALQCYLNDREILHFVHGIRELGERASQIVQDMLQFSRRSTAEMGIASLTEMVKRTLKLCQHDTKFKHIDIKQVCDDTISPISCNANEIEQVIFNCLRNAAEAFLLYPTPHSNAEIMIRTTAHGTKAFIEIIDNGPGMSEKVQKRIFEPFFTTKEVGQGVGLGLSISYFIITTKHQGEMWVHSKEGQGTTITIALPI